jgi:hypothetical protein
MKNDFKPVVDHRFNLRGDWGAVDCEVRPDSLSLLSISRTRARRAKSAPGSKCAANRSDLAKH